MARSSRRVGFWKSAILLACSLCVSPAAAVADAPQVTPATALAKKIYESTGVQGGLIVHLPCGDGTLTVALRASDAYLVHGLDTDAQHVAQARGHIQKLGQYGPIAVDHLRGKRLPYIDNLVNLLVAEDLGAVAMDEVMRVLCPGGIAYIQEGDKWTRTQKPRPDNIDDWTHYLHDATNNAVAHDLAVGPPRHLQWLGSPRYSRHHDHMSAASAMVTSGGRLFYIFDHASPMSIQLPSDWRLVARDAFNGTILWNRPIADWHTRMFRLKSGPIQLTRRLVADGDRVFATLGLNAPVSALNAATGETIREYKGTDNTEELLFSDGTLFLLINDSPDKQPDAPARLRYEFVEGPRRILAVDADTGKVLWKQRQKGVLPLTLTADAKRVLFDNGERVVCLDRRDGKQLWQTEALNRRSIIPTFFSPTLVIYDDVVLYSGGSGNADEKNRGGGSNKMYAFAAATGKTLWTGDHPPSGYKSPEDILVVDDLVWTTATTQGSDSGVMVGRDLRTGDIRKQFLPDVETHWFHHRCYRAKATDKYILTSRTGIEFVDPKTEHWECHHWVRGACLYGVMPANGMVYNPPHPCACYLEAKLYGFNALAPAAATRKVPRNVPGQDRLKRGPAYGEIAKVKSAAQQQDDWPTYRSDPARSGFTKTSVPENIQRTWQTELGGRLSSLVAAGGKLFVASIDTHTVHALDADSGKPAWSFTAGGRVDSPPTIHGGRVLFGSADGYVYCLRAADGVLAWRFRAAPVDRRMSSFEQLESVWPVHGSVLVRDGQLWCVAGRSMFVDGGLRLLRLDPATGELISETVLDERDPDSGENLQVRLKTLNMPVALPDVLSCDDKYVYMRSQRFDLDGGRQEVEVPTLDVSAQRGEGPHLFSPTGFLDDVWWHRSYWVFGRVWKSGAGGYYQAGRVAPAGRPMVFNESTVYGYGRMPQFYRWTTPMEYQLFATSKQPELTAAPKRNAPRAAAAAKGKTAAKPRKNRGTLGRAPATRIKFDWTQESPLLVRAMVLADKTLFVAGPPDVVDEEQSLATFERDATQQQLVRQAAVLDGAEGARLWAVSTADGSKLAEFKLKSVPVFDGLIAAGGRLYMTTTDGKVQCFAGR